MRTFTRRSIAAGTTVAIVVLVAVGVAIAAWRSAGPGTGTAAAGSAIALSVTVGKASGLSPAQSVDVGFTVYNANAYAVTLTTAHLETVKVDAKHATCNVAWVTGADVSLRDVIPAGGTSASHDFTISMSNKAGDACQGATFAFDLVVSGASS